MKFANFIIGFPTATNTTADMNYSTPFSRTVSVFTSCRPKCRIPLGDKMSEDKRRFDFHGLGLAIKKAREERGWTQAYVAELVGRTDRTIMSIENKGQHPSFNLFFKLVTLFDISVDQFFYVEKQREGNSCRKHIDVMLNTMCEQELMVIEATAEGLKKAREAEVHK